MRWAPITARCHVDLTGVRIGVGDELRDCLGWNRWMHHYDVGLPADACHRCNVAHEIEIELLIKRRVDRVPTADQEECMAVRDRTRDRFGPNVAGGTWT